jgi:hypothetical protein
MSESKQQRMKYTYVTAWSVIGGINLPTDLPTMEIVTEDGTTGILTKEPDGFLAQIDRGTAVGNLFLHTVFGPALTGSVDERLELQLNQIREGRKQQVGTFPVLIFSGTGDVEVSLDSSAHRYGDFMTVFDGLDKESIRKQHRLEIHAMKASLGLQASSRVQFKQVASGVYLTPEEGLTLYSLNISMRADLTVSSPLDTSAPAIISELFQNLRQDRDLQSVLRLYAEMNDQSREPLRVFLAGFFALEILIHKAFSRYEEEVLTQLQAGRQAFFSKKFVERLRETMSGKYRLADKFLLVSAALFHDMDEGTAEAEFQRFMLLKKQRDEISHGNEFSEDQLPVAQLHELLTKYIVAHAVRCKNTASLEQPQ